MADCNGFLEMGYIIRDRWENIYDGSVHNGSYLIGVK